MSASAEITIFTKLGRPGDPDGALLSKRITLGPDGKPVSDGSPCRMATGTAVTVPAPDAATLAGMINNMARNNALALGSLNAGIALGTTVQVVTANALKGVPEAQRGTSVIARIREFLPFVAGQQGWMLLDTDLKGMPASVQGQIEAAGGIWEALLNVAPGLGQAARVLRPSTSTGLLRSDTGEQFPGSGGMHLYILVQDGPDIDRAIRALHDRCWLHGLGWFVISSSGQLLVRSIVDVAVRYPERPVFEGPPEVVPPLMQDVAMRSCQAIVGAAIDTLAVLPGLTADDREAVEAMQKAQRQAIEPQAQVIRAAADQRLVDALIARTGVPRSTAMRQVEARHRGILTPDIELITDHLGTVTVRNILAGPERFVWETLCDPLDGLASGPNKARFLPSQRDPGRVFIHSFAHGGQTYDLKHDLRSAKAVLETMPVEQLGDVLCEVVDAAELEEDEVRQLLVLCADRSTTVGVQIFTRRLKQDREERARKRRLVQAAKRNALDLKVHMPAPGKNAEITPVISEIDRVLCDDDSDHPSMRRPNGKLVEVRVEEPADLHQLAMDGDPGGEIKPPPPEPLLMDMNTDIVKQLVERFIVFDRQDRRGNPLPPGSLPTEFARAYMVMAPGLVMPPRPISRLPQVRSVVTAPMVAADGTVIDGVGLDRHSGLFFHIEPWIRNCIPSGPISADDVREAVRFLLKEWLPDVLMDDTGKLISLTKCLTVIERNLLDKRPGFLTSSGLRGIGKTTLGHLETTAVLGRPATAALWAKEPEERRKALFAYSLQGIAALIFDNIPDGTEITCAVIEEALTSPLISDRVLGVTDTRTALTNMVVSFNGNNIRVGGALASRVLGNRLITDDPRPEDRQVTHTNPIAWTATNRPRILKALYTILIYGCRSRLDGQAPRTRFDTWWWLVGWPIEAAAALYDPTLHFNCVECFKVTEAQDTKKAGVVSALDLLRRQFGSIPRGAPVNPTLQFGSVNIRSILDAGERGRMDPGKTGAQGQIDLANEFLDLFESLYGKRHRSPSKNLIGEGLKTIVDRPEELDPTTIGILRFRNAHNVGRFHVEVHPPPPNAKLLVFPTT